MKHIKLLVVFYLLSVYCIAQTKQDLHIPDHVPVVKRATYVQFTGTRVFVDKPQGYEYVKQLIRFQKNTNTYFQVIESQLSDFEARKASVKKEYQLAINSGKIPPMYYTRDFKLGNYNALLYYAGAPAARNEQIVLTFGNKNFTVIAFGEMLAGDKVSRDEILNALLSLYVDEKKSADATALANYSIDVSNTDFKYTGNISQMYFYTIGGKGDPANNPYENQIIVQTLPALKGPAALKEHAVAMMDRYKSSKIEIANYAGRDITINGRYAYELTIIGSFQGKTCTMYQIVTGDDKTSLLFGGSVFGTRPDLMKQIKKIGQTLKIK